MDTQIGRGQVKSVIIAAGIFIVAIVVIATVQPKPGQSIALGLMIAAATTASAAGIGFLFALPRSVSVSVPMGAERPSRGLTIRPNTNLEDVSDWLTKIIIGLTLTQLGKIPSAAAHLFGVLVYGIESVFVHPSVSTVNAYCDDKGRLATSPQRDIHLGNFALLAPCLIWACRNLDGLVLGQPRAEGLEKLAISISGHGTLPPYHAAQTKQPKRKRRRRRSTAATAADSE